MSKPDSIIRQVDMEEMDRDDICGHIKRNGRPCLQPSGMGTDHQGTGFCTYHDKARAVVHGRYSSKKTGEALAMYMEMLEDPEMTSIDDEIALLRATVSEVDEMLEELREDSGGKLVPAVQLTGDGGTDDSDRKTVMVLMTKKVEVVKQVAILVERKKKIEEGRMMSFRQVEEVLAQVLFVIKKSCEGCNRLERLAEEFAQIDITKA